MVQHKGRLETPRWAREKRAVWARVIIVLAVAGLGYSLSRIQVARAEEFAAVARENMLRPVTVRAPRGTIYDRHGRVVAENRVAYQIQIMPAPLDELRRQVEELRPILELEDAEIELAFRRFRASPNQPMAVLTDASLDQVARLEERRREFPHILIHQYPKRYYTAGAAVAHLIGYVAEISQEELQQPRFAGYRQGRWIGKAGIERQYERTLGGQPGIRYLEVDARGGIRRWLPEHMGVPPIPGQDIHLELDLDLQRYGAFLLQEQARALGMERAEGAFVAMDPRTGGVLALYSNPSYDPNLFTGGISSAIWRELQDDPTKPLLDRAAGAAQPPGSTFKMTLAAMALEAGVITPEEFMPIACGGGLNYAGRYARCWTTHGVRMNLPLALRQSCNVYFYQVGIRLGFERFMAMGTRAGLGSRTGIDLASEIASTFPRDAEWFERWFGYPPQPSEIMTLSIGQGAVIMTPLKLTQAVTAFARPDGYQVQPRLIQADAEPELVNQHAITERQLAEIRKGMRMVMRSGGTAGLSTVAHWDVGGKTGTAQNPHGENHAWFVAWGGPPGQEPEIVATMLLYYGLSGSAGASAPVMNAINFYLNRKYGRPFDRYATPRERSARGLPFDWGIVQRPVEDLPIYGYPEE
jgi:penicillin-binding protein 2